MPRPDRPAVCCFTLKFHAVSQMIWADLSSAELGWARLSSAELIWADRPRSTFRDFGDNILKITSNVQSSTRNRPKNFPFTPDLLQSLQERARGGPCCFWALISKILHTLCFIFLNKSNKNFLKFFDDLLKSASEFAKIQTSPRKNAKT